MQNSFIIYKQVSYFLIMSSYILNEIKLCKPENHDAYINTASFVRVIFIISSRLSNIFEIKSHTLVDCINNEKKKHLFKFPIKANKTEQ